MALGNETVGWAYENGLRVVIQCAASGSQEDDDTKCRFSAEPCLRTLLSAKGPDVPLGSLAHQLFCPACGRRRMRILSFWPAVGKAQPNQTEATAG